MRLYSFQSLFPRWPRVQADTVQAGENELSWTRVRNGEPKMRRPLVEFNTMKRD